MSVLARQVQYLEIATIARDADLQARVGLDAELVKEYAAQMKAGATFPPVLVFVSANSSALVDGFHRVAARDALGHTTVLAETRPGSREDAIWAGLAANQKHGLRRSNDDKHRCVVRALTHPRSQLLSNRQIASHCGVHHHTVGRIRQQLEESRAIEVQAARIVTRSGSSYTQRLSGLRANRMSSGHTLAPAALEVRETSVPYRAVEAEVGADFATQHTGDVTSSTRYTAVEVVSPGALPRGLARRVQYEVERAALRPRVERVRDCIRQANGCLADALEALPMTEGCPDRELRKLFMLLTHLRRELSSAEDRLVDARGGDSSTREN
jgi:hypothetical protein